MDDSYVRRSWVEVDLAIIKKNYDIYRNHLNDQTDIMAVVKADAYGHGDVEVALVLQNQGVKNFAVSNISEAIKLRKAGIGGQILILGYTPVDELDALVEYDITQTIISQEYAQLLIEKKASMKCQLALDTGMNRIGIDVENHSECEKIIRLCYSSLKLTGIFTHLCVADNQDFESDIFTKNQIKKFREICCMISDLQLPYRHYCNSAAGLWHNNDGNLVRLGIILYGLKPSYHNVLPTGIEPALKWKSVVSMVKTVYPGETIGYGRTYFVEKEMQIATIPTGYADGYNRLLSNKGEVLIRGKKAPIVGRICMDQFMVDVSNIPDVEIEEEVVLIGRSGNETITADEMAEMLETIGYEIVCDISKRVPRVYV